MKIRLASKEDIPALTDLFFEFYWDFNMNTILTGLNKELLRVDNPKAFASSSINSYFEEGDIVYLYEEDGKIVGYISGSIKNHKHYLHPLEAHIDDWFVTKSYRGRGLGKALYDKFLEDVKEKGAEFVTLEAFSTNEQTIKTYERMGFTKEEVVLKKII